MSFPAISGAAFFDDQEKRRARDEDASFRRSELGLRSKALDLQGMELQERRLERQDTRRTTQFKNTADSYKEFLGYVDKAQTASPDPARFEQLLETVFLPMAASYQRQFEGLGVEFDAIGRLKAVVSGGMTQAEAAKVEGKKKGTSAVAELEAAGVPTTPENIATKVGVPPREPMKFQSDRGKQLADIDLAKKLYGEKSPQVVALKEAASGMATDFNEVRGLRQEFTQLSKDFIQARDGFERVTSAPDTAAGDIALIFGFMKTLDPNSTVREGEAATVQNAAGIPERIRNLYNKAIEGTRLGPDQRQDLKRTAGAAFGTQLANQTRLESTFMRQAALRKFDPREVVLDFVGDDLRKPAKDEKRDFSSMTTKELLGVNPSELTGEELDTYRAALRKAAGK